MLRDCRSGCRHPKVSVLDELGILTYWTFYKALENDKAAPGRRSVAKSFEPTGRSLSAAEPVGEGSHCDWLFSRANQRTRWETEKKRGTPSTPLLQYPLFHLLGLVWLIFAMFARAICDIDWISDSGVEICCFSVTTVCISTGRSLPISKYGCRPPPPGCMQLSPLTQAQNKRRQLASRLRPMWPEVTRLSAFVAASSVRLVWSFWVQ